MKTPTLPTLWRGRIPSALTLLASSVLLANAAVAQDSASGEIEEVVITGSYIKGAGTDEASPVEVLNNDYIQQSGAITVGELTQKLAVSSGAENNPDSFTSGELQGTTNVNLRGLGLTSTLVLINGKRQTLAAAVANDGSVFVDTSTVPMAALERVEILKEGATATYGSDAVAGVVNFILRDEFEGFEMSAGYQTTATSSQDTFDVSMLGGWESGGTNYVVAASFQQQDPLSSAERDYTTINAISTLGRSFMSLAPGNVGTGAYAGTYNLLETIPDANCEANGGVLPGAGFVPAGAFDAVYGVPTGGGQLCGFLYGPRFNLVNDEERTNLYASMKRDMANGVTMKAELGFVKNEVFDNPQSPSYPNLAFPTILPGQAGSPFAGPVRWYGRPFGSDSPSPNAPRNSETIRAAIDFTGSFSNDWDWNASLTYSENDREAYQPDTYKSRLEDALAGVGGASGTETFNIFDPSQNSAELKDYLTAITYTNRVTELLVGDLVVSGSWIDMPGGTSSVAYGAQWRSEGYKVNRSDDYIRRPDPVTGNMGVDLIFLGGGNEVDASRDAIAVFAEANLPMSESIELSVAGRYEALDTDNSLDSKISLRWQMADNLVFRASGSTAFREPSLVQLNNQGTSLQGLVDPNSGSSSALFVQVISEGNPTLKPEQSTNTNLGLVWSPSDNLDMRVDYWKFNYKDVITVENAQGKLDADPNGDFVSRVDGVLNGVGVSFINAAKVNTDGIDVAVDWNIPAGGAGDFGLRLAATQFFKYEIPTANGTKDVVGLFNHDNFVRSMPKTKWNLTADWENGNHRLAAVIYDTSSYRTEREVAPAAQAMGFSNSIGSWTTIDLQYSYNFMMGGTEGVITLGGKNITDEEAPRVFDAANFSYDPKQHDPRGQMWYGRIKFAL